jgi:lipopolysaccharide export system ATP-binding protein
LPLGFIFHLILIMTEPTLGTSVLVKLFSFLGDRQPHSEAGDPPSRQSVGQAPITAVDNSPTRARARAPSAGHSDERQQQHARSGLIIHGITKSFGQKTVGRGISLAVDRGESVGLLGPNGAGKTTIFYMVVGLIRADNGHIELDGFDITPLPMYRRARLGIGYLPQEPSIFRGLSVEKNINAILEIVEPDRDHREAILDELLDNFGISHIRTSTAISLSGGERRRVEIARAVASRPSFMLLDEPFAGIDPIAVGDIQALVQQLTARGIGVLITDHNVRETLGLIDRAYIIFDGQVLMQGTPKEIVSHPDVRRVYLGDQFNI